MGKERFAILFERYLQEDNLSPEELLELSAIIRDAGNETLVDVFLKAAYNNPAFAKENEAAQQAVYQNLLSAIHHHRQKSKPLLFLNYRWLAGIAALLVMGVGIYLFKLPPKQQHAVRRTAVNDIAPGSNKATLTLANGTKLILGDSIEGRLANEAGVQVSKTKNGEIIYSVTGYAVANGQTQYNILSTVKKEQYQIVLADGSRVWLNASSSLKYPTSFTGRERAVELTGEAYFEIAQNTNKPFIVKTANQEVVVLGTHFNINAYPDERATRTTLLEGSVRIRSLATPGVSKILKPDQQAVHNGNQLIIQEVDTEESVAWKNGYFLFNDEDLDSVIRKLSRWYDVEFVCTDSNQLKQVFAGSITRFTHVSKVLSMLEKAGDIHFTIDGQRIIIDK